MFVSTPFQAPIGLMSAMHEELALLLDAMPDEQRVTAAGRDFWQGHWQGRPVVAVLSRIGKVAAATTATALIERFGVQRIVFTGVAGGMGLGVRVGDAGGGRGLGRQCVFELKPLTQALREWRATYLRSTLSISDCQPSPVDLKYAMTSGL